MVEFGAPGMAGSDLGSPQMADHPAGFLSAAMGAPGDFMALRLRELERKENVMAGRFWHDAHQGQPLELQLWGAR